MSCETSNPLVLTLIEATVSLYPERYPGVAATDQPVWPCLCAESLRMSPRLLVIETFPTGAVVPRRNVIVLGHTITLGRLWSLDRTLMEPEIGAGRYHLVVTWTEEDTGTTRTRTYTGVTVDANSVEARDRMESGEEITLAAEVMVPTGGTTRPTVIPELVDENGDALTDENVTPVLG
jgi:hypothetical protein